MSNLYSRIIFELQNIYMLVDLQKDLEYAVIKSARKLDELLKKCDDSNALEIRLIDFLDCDEQEAEELAQYMDNLAYEVTNEDGPTNYTAIKEYSEEIWYKIFTLKKWQEKNERSTK